MDQLSFDTATKKSLVEFEPKFFFGFAELSHTVTWEQDALPNNKNTM